MLEEEQERDHLAWHEALVETPTHDVPVLNDTGLGYAVEDCPFQTLLVDVTHRCNMACKNCYIPNRDIPDLDVDWLIAQLERLPRRTRIRLVGAEPTVRKDLPELIARVRATGHLPILMTNGLKLGNRDYVRELKAAGLRAVYLSLNGGFDEDLYEVLDDLRCGARKWQAFDNLIAENMYLSLGMILGRGINEQQIAPLFEHARQFRQVYEVHYRSIGPFGRYMQSDAFSLEELIELFAATTGVPRATIDAVRDAEHFVDFVVDRLKVQLTQWPDLGSATRGRLVPDGTVHPAFEHMIANEGGY